MIQFTIPGEPQGKARARTGKGFAYTPEKTVNYEALIKQIYVFETLNGKPKGLIDKPVEMSIKAFYTIPKSVSDKKQTEMLGGKIRPTKKPDVDNIAKIVCDGLNNVAYKDDTQVVRLTIEKYYSDCPRVEVELREVS